MSWFNKKSWQLRRKIKDLQSDLAAAEREGKYVLEQGLFFAELEDMGEMTMMVFGTADHLASQEEGVIRTFFDRNGFSVDTLKIGQGGATLLEAEILPAEEMTRHAGKLLKSQGYRIIDDSEQERPADLDKKIIPLSALVRGMVVLFSQQVQHVISTTRIKMNKEGNRLLHWMPRIVETISKKISPGVLDVLKPAFNEAYEVFYGSVGKGGEVSPMTGEKASSSPAATPSAEKIPAINFQSSKSTSTPAPAASAPAAPPARPQPQPGASFTLSAPAGARPQGPAAVAAAAAGNNEAQKDRQTAEAMAKMYRSLIGANSNRCVRNAEVLLDEVNRLFNATATCLMVKVPNGDGFTIHANAGKRLTWGEAGEGYPVSSSVLTRCMQNRAAVSNERLSGGDPSESMVMHQIEAAAAAPILVKDDILGILYVDRRQNPVPFDDIDCKNLQKLSDVFREFPDLVLGQVS